MFELWLCKVPLAKLNRLAKQSISPDLLARIIIQEDLGNLVLIGDKEAVDSVQIALASIENKLLEAGDGLTREYLQPVNTKPADLIKNGRMRQWKQPRTLKSLWTSARICW